MGTCRHCSKEILLKESDSIKCYNCGSNTPYVCWNCNFIIQDKLKECSVCHFMVCDKCGVCGQECKLTEIQEQTKNMNKREIIDYVYNFKNGLIRRDCPYGTPVSYAKGRLKTMAIRLKGFRVRDQGDQESFEKRFDKIIDFPLGKTWVIKEIREPGSYGVEYREVSYLAKCMGLVDINIKVNKKGEEYIQFERVKKERCEYVRWDDLVLKECPKCKTKYTKKAQTCSNVSCYNTKGKYKNQPRNLIIKIHKGKFCKLPLSNFNKHEVLDGKTN